MQIFLPQNDTQFKEAFYSISNENSNSYIRKIASLIVEDTLNEKSLESILEKDNLENVTAIKEEILDMLLEYINFILKDGAITENEARILKLLKRFFKIREGDFYNYRYTEIKNILDKQFSILYSDNKINREEALHKVGLQELFDLGYDQFLELVDKEVKAAVDRGANKEQLDTVFSKAYQLRNLRSRRNKNIWRRLLSKIFGD